MPNEPVLSPRWLLLVHQLPPRPSNLRVHVWRRLQQVGAVALRNSLYVLPNTSEAREDFEWIRSEIAGRGGQVSILAAQAVDGYTDDELEASFRTLRTGEYDTLIREIDALRKQLASKRSRRTSLQRNVVRIRERFHTLRATDFFGAPRAGDAQAALERLEETLQPAVAAQGSTQRLDPSAFRRRVWVTRPRPGIDRMASAWLIRRFIAPDARFVFSSAPERDQVPFDMADVDFGHHGSECTYETLMRRFGLRDGSAVRIGQLVHDLDLKESRYGISDGPTVARLVEGLRRSGRSDPDILEGGITIIDALYRSFAGDADPRPRPPRRRTRPTET